MLSLLLPLLESTIAECIRDTSFVNWLTPEELVFLRDFQARIRDKCDRERW